MHRAHPIAGLGALVCLLSLSALARQGSQDVGHPGDPPRTVARSPRERVRGSQVPPAQSAAVRALDEGHPMDLSTATAEELQLLPRIGPALAARIVAYRSHGRLTSVEELLAVRGIGPATLRSVRPFLSVAAGPGMPADGGAEGPVAAVSTR